jgi:hypothetical protein
MLSSSSPNFRTSTYVLIQKAIHPELPIYSARISKSYRIAIAPVEFNQTDLTAAFSTTQIETGFLTKNLGSYAEYLPKTRFLTLVQDLSTTNKSIEPRLKL